MFQVTHTLPFRATRDVVSLPGEYHLFGYQEAVEKSFRLGQGLVYNILAVFAVITDLTNFVDTVVSAVRLARKYQGFPQSP